MKDIEIVASPSGPTVCVILLVHAEMLMHHQVKLSGKAASAAGEKTMKVSLSHSDTSVVAFAVAQ